MDTEKSNGSPASRGAGSDKQDDIAKAEQLDRQLRELYAAYGKGDMPEEVRKLAQALDRQRAALRAKPDPEDGKV
ncbi:MAG: hypothetical protein ACXIVO_08885 [Glycocaulis sp.]